MFDKCLSKAVAKLDANRPHFEPVYFNAESGEYAATNGHILLVESTTDKPAESSALLNPITGAPVVDGNPETFPDYQLLYLKKGDSFDWSRTPCKVYKFTGKKRNGRAAIIVEIDGVLFNFDYLKTVVEFFNGESVSVTGSVKKEGYDWKMYQFLNADESKRALLMPIRGPIDDDYVFVKTLSNYNELADKQKKEEVVYIVVVAGVDVLAAFKTRAKADEFAAACGAGVEVKTVVVQD